MGQSGTAAGRPQSTATRNAELKRLAAEAARRAASAPKASPAVRAEELHPDTALPGTILTVAGTGNFGDGGVGGPAVDADLDGSVIARDSDDNIFVPNAVDQSIEEFTAGGDISSVASTSISAGVQQLGVGANDTLVFEDAFSAYEERPGFASDTVCTQCTHETAGGVLVDGNGHVYVAAGGLQIYGEPTTGFVGLGVEPTAIAFDEQGDLVVAGRSTNGYAVMVYDNAGDGFVLASGLPSISGMTVDEDDDVFIAEGANGNIDSQATDSAQVAKITPDGTVSVIAGTGVEGFSGDGGPATSAQMDFPGGLALDSSGDLFIADDARVREVIDAGAPAAALPLNGPFQPAPFPHDVLSKVEENGGGNPSEACSCGRGEATKNPVDTASGEFWHTQTDMAVPGRGPSLDVTRSYSSDLASSYGPLGHGWTWPYTMSVTQDPYGNMIVHQENGSVVAFKPNGGAFVPEQPRELATLGFNASGQLVFTRRDGEAFAFNGLGQLQSIADRNGNTTTLGYDGNSGNVSTITDPAGRVAHVTTANGLVTRVQDSSGRTVTYGYNTFGDLTSVVEPTGATWTYGYDSKNRLTTILDPNQQSAAIPQPLTNVYNSSGQVTSQTDYAGRTTGFAYTGDPFTDAGGATTITDPRVEVTVDNYTDGLLRSSIAGSGTPSAATTSYGYDPTTFAQTSVTDPNGHTQHATYDSAGDELTSTNPSGDTKTMTYNSFGQVLTSQDANLVTTTNTYDADGNLTSQSTPVNSTQTATTHFGYTDPSNPGMITATTDPRGKITSYSYDTDGELTATTDPDGNVTRYSYTCSPAGPGCRSNIGLTYTTTSPRLNATTYTYDDAGQQLSTTDPGGHVSSETFDLDGNRVTTTDAKGHVTTYGYNRDGELTATTLPGGQITTISHDGDGNVTSQTTPRGTTSYEYDPLNRVTKMTTPPTASQAGGIVTSYGYDADGDGTTITAPGTGAGTLTTTNTYDISDRLTGTTYSDGTTPAVSYGYDPDGRRTSMTDGTGTSHYTYDLAGRLTDMTNGAGHEIQYTYDLDGDPTSITYPNGNSVTRGYDDADLQTSLTDWNAHTTTFGYNADGGLNLIHYPNGVKETTSFNTIGQTVGMTDALATTTLASYTYARNADQQLTGATASGGSAGPSETYAYSIDNRLNSLTTGGTTGTYNFNGIGNVTQEPDGTTLTYDTAEELTTSTSPAGVVSHYTYDPRGNRTVIAPTGGTTKNYSYDQANRLTGYTAGSATASYTYDGNGLLASTTTGTTSTSDTWDTVIGSDPLMLTDNHTNYIYGPNDQPIEQVASDGTTTYIQHDQNGSTRLITNSTGGVTGTYSYTPYGAITSHTGTATTPLLYDGEYADPTTGLYFLRTRYYDPNTVQFLTRDPLEASTKAPYGYAGDDPLDASDPSGQQLAANSAASAPTGVLPALPNDYIPWDQLYQLEMRGKIGACAYQHYLSEETLRFYEVLGLSNLNSSENIADEDQALAIGSATLKQAFVVADDGVHCVAAGASLGAAGGVVLSEGGPVGILVGTVGGFAAGCAYGVVKHNLPPDPVALP
jgi:RHS repeat-associated protein